MKEKIVFMGTPEFAVSSLRKLVEKGFNVSLVVTQPDKPAGRGRKLTPPPVKVEAEKLKIPVLQPEKIKDNPELEKLLRKISPDLIVVVAYGKLLPPWLLTLPKYGAVNLHASLLPEYRGASPIQSVLLDGKEKTGVTVMKISEELDAGDILSQREVEIYKSDNAKTLHDRLSQIGAELLAETLPLYVEGKIIPQPQDHSKATYCPKITKEMGKIDWQESAVKIFNKIRAFTPWPSAYTFLEGRRIKITEAEPLMEETSFPPGTVIKADKELLVSAGRGILRILKLKPEGKKEITAEEFIRGYPIKVGKNLQ